MFIIKPYEGVSSLTFGLSSKQISEVLGTSPNKSVDRYSKGYITTDVYDGLFVELDETGRCISLEFFEPSRVSFQGIQLLGEKYSYVKEFMLKHDFELLVDDSGFTSLTYGFGVYTPFPDEVSSLVESVIAFKEGYYG